MTREIRENKSLAKISAPTVLLVRLTQSRFAVAECDGVRLLKVMRCVGRRRGGF